MSNTSTLPHKNNTVSAVKPADKAVSAVSTGSPRSSGQEGVIEGKAQTPVTVPGVSAKPVVPARSKLPAFVKRTAFFLMYSAISLGLILALWLILHQTSEGIPDPLSTLGVLWGLVSNPFYNNGPNDMGIGFQIVSSLGNVIQGFLLGSLFSIPIGILMGSSEVFKRIMNPIAQILRPVSPLAWFPIGLASLHSAAGATVFVIFITSLWPTLINTAFGVASLPQDYKTLAKVFRFTRLRYVRVVVLPYSLPYILTGLRLSLGIAWMVIVAAEMLAGGQGVGFFVWDSWNALNLERVISAIIIIGTIGLIMDRGMEYLVRKTSYGV